MLALGLWVPAVAAAQTALPARGDLSVAVDAGVAATTRWFRANGADGTPGFGPTFGAGAELALSPTTGLRLHGSFARHHVTSAAAPSSGLFARRVNADLLFYDLSLVARPFAAAGPRALRGAWVSAGAGAVTTWFQGDTSEFSGDCRGEFALSGICVPRGATTRPQATAGVAIDAVPIARNLTLFARLEGHVYRPPVRELSITSCVGTSNLCSSRPYRAGRARDTDALSDLRFQAGVGPPSTMVSAISATGRLVLGLRVGGNARRQRADTLAAGFSPPTEVLPVRPTEPPAPPPTTGGYVEVSTAAPGAAVYLVPINRWRRAAMLCGLRPVHGPGSYYQGTTASSVPVNALIRRPITHFLVVVQGGRYYEERIQVVNNAVERRQLNMAVDGVPTGCR